MVECALEFILLLSPQACSGRRNGYGRTLFVGLKSLQQFHWNSRRAGAATNLKSMNNFVDPSDFPKNRGYGRSKGE
jgi:hypothetical protein